MLIAAVFYCAQPARAGIVKMSGADFKTASALIEKFLYQPETVTSEQLAEAFAEVQNDDSARLLDLVFSDALNNSTDPARVESLLRVPFSPGSSYQPNQASRDLKEKAAKLIAMYPHSPLTLKALATRVRDFDLWSMQLLPFIKEQAETEAGLHYVYPAIEKLAARFTQKQAEDLAEAVRKIPGDSPLKLAALFRLEIFNHEDLRAMLKFGSEFYASSFAGNEAFLSALYSLVTYIRLNKEGSLAVFEEEKARAIATLSVFNKRTKFYQAFLRQGFQIDPQPGDCRKDLM